MWLSAFLANEKIEKHHLFVRLPNEQAGNVFYHYTIAEEMPPAFLAEIGGDFINVYLCHNGEGKQ